MQMEEKGLIQRKGEMREKEPKAQKYTLADLSSEPVMKCVPSMDFESDVIPFLWLVSLSDSLSSFPVWHKEKYEMLTSCHA